MHTTARLLRRLAGPILVLVFLGLAAGTAAAQGYTSYTKKGSYEDVKFELQNAIVAAGLKVDYNGQIGKMLERTGADVGSTKPLYKSAEFFTFCSAKLSRQMMEADERNIGLCPYVMFVSESAAKPGMISVGYRAMPAAGNKASLAAFKEINAMLDKIAKAAAK